jgi:PPP family 3-phenylpropionic acid transporter
MNPAPPGYAYGRLSSYYFLYFACLGVMVPYWSLYLEASGLGAPAIGAVLAASSATRIVAPNLWGWLADRSGLRVEIIRIGAIGAALLFAGLLFDPPLGVVVALVVLHTFFWNAILAQYEVITLASMGGEVHRYGQVRLWGSVSFVLVVVAAGALFDRVEVTNLPWVMTLLLAALAAGSFTIRDPGIEPRAREAGGLGVLLRSRVLWAFLWASFLMQLGHAPYYGFFSLLLDRHGYSRAQIGWLWALGVIAEILLFAVAHRLLARISLRRLLLASLLLAALRWAIIGLATGLVPMLVLAQCLHAASFGSFHAAGVELVRRHFGLAHQGQGQALYSAFSFGAGGALGALASGGLWDIDARLGFLLASVASLWGWWIVREHVHGPLVGSGDGGVPVDGARA